MGDDEFGDELEDSEDNSGDNSESDSDSNSEEESSDYDEGSNSDNSNADENEEKEYDESEENIDEYDDEEDFETADLFDENEDLSGDFADIDDKYCTGDDELWTDDFYDEAANEIFGDNEYFGDTAEQQYVDEGYELFDDSSYFEEIESKIPESTNGMKFYRKDGQIVPTGFTSIASLLLMRKIFPNFDWSRIHSVLPITPEYENREFSPKKLPANLANVDPKDKVDLRNFSSPVGDQGQTGRCKAFAITHAVEMLKIMLKLGDTRLACTYALMQTEKQKGTFENFKQCYLADNGTDSGVEPLRHVLNKGICSEKLWPNDSPEPKTNEAQMDKDAQLKKIDAVVQEINLDDIKKVLTKGYPVPFEMATGESFMNIGRDGLYKISEGPEGKHGCHAMLIVGYIGNYFIIKNSWGPNWGDNGYCYIPKKVLIDAGYGFFVVMPRN